MDEITLGIPKAEYCQRESPAPSGPCVKGTEPWDLYLVLRKKLVEELSRERKEWRVGTWYQIWCQPSGRPVGITSLSPLQKTQALRLPVLGPVPLWQTPSAPSVPWQADRIHRSPSASCSPANVSPDSLGVQDLGSKQRWGRDSGF